MKRTLITAAVLSGAIILTVCRAQNGDDFQPDKPQRTPAIDAGASQNTSGSDTNPAQQPRKTITINIPVVETIYVDEPTSNGVRKVARRTINYVQHEVPAPTAEETQRLRDELRELNGKRIDLLDSAELLEAVSRAGQEVEELQAWAKLVEIQAELKELTKVHEGTNAAQIAADLLGRIPSQRPGIAPSVRPVPHYPDGASPYYPGGSKGESQRAKPDEVKPRDPDQ
jgi:hypothetical protein